MADGIASVLTQNLDSMRLLAHLEELRKRIILTEPFNLYLEVGFVAGLFVASPFVFYQLWLFVAPGLYRKREALCSALFSQYRRIVSSRRVVRLQDGVSGVAGFLNRLRPMLPAADHDWGIYKAVSNDHHRARVDFRNAHSRLLPRSDAGDYGSLDVAQSAIFHTCHFCSRSNRYTCHRHLEHVPFCCPDGRALRNEHRSGLGGNPRADAKDVTV